MPEYCFFKKDKQIVVLKKSEEQRAVELTEQGYEKQFEEVIAANETLALARFADIRKEKEIDQHNFLAGAIAMPLIGIVTAAATSLLTKKKDTSKT